MNYIPVHNGTAAVLIAAAAATGALLGIYFWARRDPAGWQRRIDREYLLTIDGHRVSLYHQGKLTTQFEWNDVIEIRHVRHSGFPPLFWKVITGSGEYLLPDGGRYLRDFEERFLYALPGYHEQMTVGTGTDGMELSLWRKVDDYPKVQPFDNLQE